MPFHRYVALGDSFSEGVGDPDPALPNGVRGWADRVAEVLARDVDDFGYANLAIRGRKLQQIVDEQLEPALALDPDLVTIYAGANDLMRPKVDIDGLAASYGEAVGKLSGSGARVLVFTAFDPGGSALHRPFRGRWALYNEAVREIADRHDATVVDYWRMREFRDWNLWSEDRLHMNSAGHQQMAINVLDRLGIAHDLQPLPLVEKPALTPRELRQANLVWARTHALPWLHRRLTGRSSGDGIEPKRPRLGPVDPLP